MYGFNQLISDLTHILPASTLCIHLILTDQPNLVVDSGAHSFLHTNCHHQITYCNINHMIYPLPYECLFWDYKRTNESVVNAKLNEVDWECLLSNKSINQQIIILILSAINISSNFLPNKIVTYNDRAPPWMTSNIKDKINIVTTFMGNI